MDSYKQSVVDVEKTDNLVKKLSGIVKNIGGFGGLHELNDDYLVYSTDGVGTKIMLAQQYNSKFIE